MQPSNQRSEMGSNQNQTPSGNGGTTPNGNGDVSNNSPLMQTRPSRNERREQQRQQQQQQEQQTSDEPRRFSLAELFARDDSDEVDDDGNPIGDDPSKPPETLEALSKRLGMKPDQIYGVKIPLANGAEALTIGQLKDRVGEVVDLELRETQFEQRRMQVEGQLLQSQTEIRELLSMIPKEHINPEIVNKIRKRHEANMAFERQMTLEHIPEWSDDKRRAEDLQGMIGFMKRWGFDESFMGTVHDHRAIKFIRDMHLRDKRIQQAMSRVTNVEPKGQRTSPKSKKNPRLNTQSNSTRRDGAVPTQQARLATLFSRSN